MLSGIKGYAIGFGCCADSIAPATSALDDPAATTGIDHWHLRLGTGKNTRLVTFKEVGGAVLGLAPDYITQGLSAIVVFASAVDRLHVPDAAMALFDALQHPAAQVCLCHVPINSRVPESRSQFVAP